MRQLCGVAQCLPHVLELNEWKVGLDLFDRPPGSEQLKKMFNGKRNPRIVTCPTSTRGRRSADAIHLATALELGPELQAFVAYDTRLADAAKASGLPVHAP